MPIPLQPNQTLAELLGTTATKPLFDNSQLLSPLSGQQFVTDGRARYYTSQLIATPISESRVGARSAQYLLSKVLSESYASNLQNWCVCQYCKSAFIVCSHDAFYRTFTEDPLQLPITFAHLFAPNVDSQGYLLAHATSSAHHKPACTTAMTHLSASTHTARYLNRKLEAAQQCGELLAEDIGCTRDEFQTLLSHVGHLYEHLAHVDWD